MADKNNPPSSRANHPSSGQKMAIRETQHLQVYEGAIPHPDILQGFEKIVPGTAKRLIDQAENESLHRRDMESRHLNASIQAQKQQLAIAEQQSRYVFWSDAIGQACGVLATLACIGGVIWLAWSGHEVVAAALAVVPIAAIIKAFFPTNIRNTKQK